MYKRKPEKINHVGGEKKTPGGASRALSRLAVGVKKKSRIRGKNSTPLTCKVHGQNIREWKGKKPSTGVGRKDVGYRNRGKGNKKTKKGEKE